MKWGQAEKENWFNEQEIKRSYQSEVVGKIKALGTKFELSQYGALSLDPKLYPLFLLRSKNFDASKKTVLITGGVHGYETSGVHGALGFLDSAASRYLDKFNIFCAPCISPWAYETINRWNIEAIDPNRSFTDDSPAEECKFLLTALAEQNVKPYIHIDLHETTDTDNSVFQPALALRDDVVHEFSEIPDGFYVVGDSENPQPGFQKAIVDAVRKVTHIAPADAQGNLIGAPLEQEGVINYPVKKLFLCTGLSNAQYTTTTEVYPDSPRATDAICIEAQIAAITGGLDYVLTRLG